MSDADNDSHVNLSDVSGWIVTRNSGLMRTFTVYECRFVLVEGDCGLFPSVLHCNDYIATPPSEDQTLSVGRECPCPYAGGTCSCADSRATYRAELGDEVEGRGFLDGTRLYVIEPRDWTNRDLGELLMEALSDVSGSYYLRW